MSDIEVFSSIEAAEPHWRALEAGASASPFQRFAWMASHVRTVSKAAGATPAIALLRGDGGGPAALLPLEKARRGGIVTLRGIGGKHASFHLPLATPEGAALLAADPGGLLRRAGAAAGADIVALTHQPAAFDGRPNPLAALVETGVADHAFETALSADAEAFIRLKTSGDARKKLRKKRQELAKLGEVVARRPADAADIAATLQAFVAQKARRFAALGLPNPFADAATQDFLRLGCAPDGGEPPAIELYALSCAGRIVAVFGLATGFGRASGMFTSFDDEAAVARCSPGDILLHDMVRDLIGRGFARFDLGVGTARYKTSFCTDEVALRDALLPLTLAGQLAAATRRTTARVKAAVKNDPRLLAAANRLRTALRRAG